jgi:hypothetical protein
MSPSKLGAALLVMLLLTPVSAFAVAPPATAVTMAVADGSGFAVTWNAVSTATQYYLWITDSSGVVRHQVWYLASAVGCNTGQPTCQKVLNLPLQPGTTYMWVQTWNADGYGPWSAEYRTLAQYGHARIVDSTGKFLGVLVDAGYLLIDYNNAPLMIPIHANGLFLNGTSLYYSALGCVGTPHTFAAFPARADGGGSTLYVRTGPTINFNYQSTRQLTPEGTLGDCFPETNTLLRAQALATVSVASIFGTITPPLTVVR